MRKKFTMLLALALCVFTSSVMAQTYYTPGERTLTLEAGKKYFISVATWYGGACTNLLYNNDGTLAKSDKLPYAIVTDDTYLFTVEETGDGCLAYIKNSDGQYIQADVLTSTETKTGVYVIPYFEGKAVCCGSDVDACDENGNKIAYASITAETPIVTVQKNADYTKSENRNGWRYIGGLSAGVDWCTAFAFYEAINPFEVEVTTDVNDPIYYTIRNVRANAYAEYAGAANAMLLKSSVADARNLFYFTAGSTAGTYKIHNAATSKTCAATNSWNADGVDWYIKKSENTSSLGLAIATSATLTEDGTEAWNDYQGNGTSIAPYGGNDAGSVWTIKKYTAEVSPFMSTESEKHLYFIKNDRVKKFANYVASGTAFTETDASNYGSYWYFVEKADAEGVPAGFKACYIYNAANDKPVQNHSNGFMSAPDDDTYPAKVYLVGFHENNYFGYVIYELGNEDNGWNDYAGGSVTTYTYDDAGSIWSIIPADKTETQLKSEAATAKNNALAFIAHAEEADYYTYSDEAIATAKAAVEAVSVDNLAAATNELLKSTFETTLTTLKATEKGTTAPAVGAYIQLKNRQYGKYLNAGESTLSGVDNSKSLSTLWLVEAGDNNANVKLKNVGTGKYIGEIRQSKDVSMVESENAKQFAWTNQTDIYGVFKETTGGDYAYGHIAGHNVLVGWLPTAEATQWVVSQQEIVLPEVGNYYLIECPLFYNTQGVKKALYSDGTNPKWKTLDATDKSFYWTVEQTESGYVLKNCNDNKYILGTSANTTSWTMAEETTGAEYAIELAGDDQVFIKIATRHLHANNHSSGNGAGSDIVSWETNSANSASAWRFIEVENPDLAIAKASLQSRIAELQVIVDNATGKIGYYKSEAGTAISGAIATAQDVLNGDSEDITTYTDALAALNTAVEGVDLSIVLPETGKFYRFKHPTKDAYMLSDVYSGDAKYLAMGALESNKVSSIFYYGGDGTLLSYANGRYLSDAAQSSSDWTCLAVGTKGNAATFGAGSAVGRVGFYVGLTQSRAYYSGNADDGFVNAGGSFGSNAGYDWVVEEVTWLPVAINATVGYATFYSPVELELSQNRVKAYTGKVEGSVLKLTEQPVVPANTGVILELQKGAEVENGYTFLQVEKETTLTGLDNDLAGTFAKTYVTEASYVLAQKNDVVGLYKAEKNQQEGASWLNNAFKAYLPAPANATAPMFSFDRGEGTTGIDNAQLTMDNVVIYDLLGRRVEKMEKGIYIVNGKKVIK